MPCPFCLARGSSVDFFLEGVFQPVVSILPFRFSGLFHLKRQEIPRFWPRVGSADLAKVRLLESLACNQSELTGFDLLVFPVQPVLTAPKAAHATKHTQVTYKGRARVFLTTGFLLKG